MQIETPVMEHIENLTSKQGGDNEKLIFKVMKRGAELQRALDKGDGELADNGLRYDLTFIVIRLDMGIPLHVPYETDKNGYFNVPKYTPGWHLAIGYPF